MTTIAQHYRRGLGTPRPRVSGVDAVAPGSGPAVGDQLTSACTGWAGGAELALVAWAAGRPEPSGEGPEAGRRRPRHAGSSAVTPLPSRRGAGSSHTGPCLAPAP